VKLDVAGSTFRGNGAQPSIDGSAIGCVCCAAVSVVGSTFLGLYQAAGTMTFGCTSGVVGALLVDRCTFDSAPLPGEDPATYLGARFVGLESSEGPTTATITRSTFRNAYPTGPFNLVAFSVRLRSRAAGGPWRLGSREAVADLAAGLAHRA
jgi:hypothetical protein